MSKFSFSLALMFSSLTLGYFIYIFVEKGVIHLPFKLIVIRKVLQKVTLLFFIPVAFLGGVWIVKLDNIKILLLPFIGIIAISLGGGLSYAFAQFQGLTRRQTGSYIVSGAFTNIGSIGGLICYIFLGETAFAMVPLYELFGNLTYFTVGFPLAKSFSIDHDMSTVSGINFKTVVKDPVAFIPVSAIIIGLILNLIGVRRPYFYTKINSVFIPTISVLFLLTIGMDMRFSSLRRYMRQSTIIVLIKHVIVPIVVSSIAFAIGFGSIEDGLPLKVVIILSSMPVAFLSMVPPTIYNLDIELANSNWLLSNIMLVIIIPSLYFITQLF